LAQEREGAEDLEPVLGHVLDEAEDLLPLALQLAVVDRAVPRVQLDFEDVLHLRREVRGDLLLGAAPHQGADPTPQRGELLGVALPLDGGPVDIGEPRRAGEQAGCDDREHRPQVHEAVLERRAGDGDLHRSGQAPGALVGLGLVILDELRLVEHQRTPRQGVVRLELDAEEGVRSHDDVGAVDVRGEVGPAPSARLLHRCHAQARREAGHLSGPVRHHAGGRHDQGRVLEPPLLLGPDDGRDGLEGLAQAHVISQHAAESVVPQERQPVVALDLVRAKVGAHALGNRRPGDVVGHGEGLDRRGPPLALRLDHAQRGEVLPEAHLEPADARRPVALNEATRLLDEASQALVLGPIEAEVRAAVQEEVGLPAG